MIDNAARRLTMVDTQVRPSDVTKFPIINAMLSVPRENFVPTDQRDAAYVGEHMMFDTNRVILDPRVFAKLLDAVDVQSDDVVLDVACGYGYSTAVLACIADAVVGLDDDETLTDTVQTAMSENGYDNAAIVHGELAQGVEKAGPFDVIMIQGAVGEVSQPLIDQLKDGGRIAAIFMEGNLGVARIGYKLDGVMNWRFAFNATAPVLPGFEKLSEFAL